MTTLAGTTRASASVWVAGWAPYMPNAALARLDAVTGEVTAGPFQIPNSSASGVGTYDAPMAMLFDGMFLWAETPSTVIKVDRQRLQVWTAQVLGPMTPSLTFTAPTCTAISRYSVVRINAARG